MILKQRAYFEDRAWVIRTLLSAQSPVWVWLTEILTRKGSGAIIRKRKERFCA